MGNQKAVRGFLIGFLWLLGFFIIKLFIVDIKNIRIQDKGFSHAIGCE
jgi:hypothetical protein